MQKPRTCRDFENRPAAAAWEMGKTTLSVKLYLQEKEKARVYINIYTLVLRARECVRIPMTTSLLCVCVGARVAVIVGVFINSTSSIEVRPLCGGGDYV